MSHQDFQVPQEGQVERSLEGFLPVFEWLGNVRSDAVALGDGCMWTVQRLTQLALAWGWVNSRGLVKGYRDVRRAFNFADESLHDASSSYQAFHKLMSRHGGGLSAAVVDALRLRMRGDSRFYTQGRPVFAFDGTKISLPITAANQESYCSKKSRRGKRGGNKPSNAKKAANPQLLVTLCWHVGLSLPWAWRQSGLQGSERGHAGEMLAELPKNSLILADAGFSGFELWDKIIKGGHDFVIRVGANVKLLTGLGFAHERRRSLVYLWPAKHRRKQPLVLRLITIRDGAETIYLATTILDETELTRDEARRLYKLRWGVEVYIRDYKQTLEHRKLLSKTAAAVEVECRWTILSHWLLAAYTILHVAEPDAKPSTKGCIEATRDTLVCLKKGAIPAEPLDAQLRLAVVDSYHRSRKASRNYPLKKHRRPPGSPQLTAASPSEVAAAQSLGFTRKAG